MNKIKVLIIFLLLVLLISVLFTLNTKNESNNMISSNFTVNKTHYNNVYQNVDVDIWKFKSKNPGKKIAFIIGVHPYEWEAHNAFYKAILNYTSSSKFKGELDLYIVKVPPEVGKLYDEGRDLGEKSTNSFVIPLIKKGNYSVVFDVHSAWPDWPYEGRPKWFLLYGPSSKSISLSHNISKNLDWAPTMDYDVFDEKEYDSYDKRVSNVIALNGTPMIILEWGWCKAESLAITKGIENINATDKGEYEDKLKHALLFLDNLNNN